jgi:hypothetical protein
VRRNSVANSSSHRVFSSYVHEHSETKSVPFVLKELNEKMNQLAMIDLRHHKQKKTMLEIQRTITTFVGTGTAATATGMTSSMVCFLLNVTMMLIRMKMMFVLYLSISYLLLTSSSILKPNLNHPFT